MTAAVKCGFRGIDTACQPRHYHEAGVGEAIQRLAYAGIDRKDLYIQTKFTPSDGQDPYNIPYDRKALLSEQVAQSFEASRKNLGVDAVDGLILHSPFESMDRTMIAWAAMEQICRQGGTVRIGISNCYDINILKQLYRDVTVKPTIQETSLVG